MAAFHFAFRYGIIKHYNIQSPFLDMALNTYVLFWIFPEDQNLIFLKIPYFIRKYVVRGLSISLQLPLKAVCAAICYTTTKPGTLIMGCQFLLLCCEVNIESSLVSIFA